uniref:Nucleolus and neural progenitor protein-like N-terminal domain-containing protein n=2 Tax=Sphaeramia orbicularis TaxID=375764 RepID=A0A672YZB6_9TELE
MKLDVALQDLSDLCPSGIQRSVSLKVCEASVPSQPMLEWVCLRVLGAAQLLNRTMSRCSRAFVLSKHHFKWEEFIVLNMVITSMLSRLWVVFRGVLVSLSTLYLELLHLRGVVAHARPMPFLTSFSLPVDLLDFLGPGGSVLIKRSLQSKKPEEKKRRRQKKEKHQQTRRVPEDLGVSVHRGLIKDSDMKPFLNIFRKFTEGKSIPHKAQKKQTFKEQMRGATSFTDAGIHLEKMIQWCRSQRMEREKRLLTFLRLKCQKMKSLEAAGYSVHRKLRTFRQEVHSVLSPQKSSPKTCGSVRSKRRSARLRSRIQTLRSEMKATTGGRRRQRRRKTEGDGRIRTRNEADPQITHCDIDDIFASAGL